MKIDGIEVIRFAESDGLPIKNHLPSELKERMKTQNQWLEDGCVLKENAVPYEMHPSCLSKKTCVYYLDTDVEKITAENTPKCCRTCEISKGRFCVVAGDFVSATHCCSEWVERKV